MKPVKIALVLVALFSLTQCKNKTEETLISDEKVTVYTTQEVRNTTIKSTVNMTGRVVPQRKINIVTEVQGVIRNSSKLFEAGERYRKGDLILTVDNTEQEYALKAQKSQFVNTLIKSMADIELDYPEAFQEWNRFLKSIDVEKALPQLPNQSNDQLRLFLSGRNIFQSYYNIKSQEERLKKYNVYAPFDGVVTQALVDAGDLVSPGVRLGELISTDGYEVITAVNPFEVSAMHIGQEILLNTKGIKEPVTATVKRFEEAVDDRTQSVNVYLSIDHDALKSGMYLEGALPLESYTNAIRIPKDLISRDDKVYVIRDGVVRTKQITIASSEEGTAVVQGLSNGDILIMEQVNPIEIGSKATAK